MMASASFFGSEVAVLVTIPLLAMAIVVALYVLVGSNRESSRHKGRLHAASGGLGGGVGGVECSEHCLPPSRVLDPIEYSLEITDRIRARTRHRNGMDAPSCKDSATGAGTSVSARAKQTSKLVIAMQK